MMPEVLPSDELFEAFFDLSLTGSIQFAPVFDVAGEVVDFTYLRLNPAAQRRLALPAQPAKTLLAHYPQALATGVFAFCRAAYEAGGAARQGEFSYQPDGQNGYYHLAARRVGQQLLVSFADAGEPPRTQVAQALRESQAREQQALAEAQRQQHLLRQLFEHAPMPLALFRGHSYVVELANPALATLWGRPLTQVLGRPIFEALPDLRDQGFDEILAGVVRSGELFRGQEVPAVLDRAHTGQAALGYFNISYQALPGNPEPTIIASAEEVTAQVLARQQLERLNHELEARVAARTQEAQTAQAAAERQQGELARVFEQAPVAIGVYRGPSYIIELANDQLLAMWQRPLAEVLGQPLLAVFPELAGQGFEQLLDQVLATGQPYATQDAAATLRRGDVVAEGFFNFVYTPLREADGRIGGVVAVITETTEQVLARRQADTMQAAMLAAAQRQARQREELYQVFEQAPAAIVLLRGPNHRIEYVNPTYQQFFPELSLRGHLIRETHPSVLTDDTLARLDQVYQTGEPYVGEEQAVELALVPGQPPQARYFNFTYQPYREAGAIVGVSIFAYDVTGAVLARRTAARQLEQLNHELEARVAARTREAQAAQAAAERQRGELERVFEQAPVAIAVYRGPSYIIELANPTVARLWGRTRAQLLGKGLFEALPEVAGMGYEELLDGVMATGVPYVAHAMEAKHEREGRLDTVYWDFVYVPTYAAEGHIDGAMVVATEVTEQVLARRRAEQLNQELETRVQERTRQLSEQQVLLRQILGQVPAYIATLSGPEHRFSFFNELYQTLAAGRAELGRPVAELLPELAEQGLVGLLDEVYRTGEPYIGTDRPVRLVQAPGDSHQYYLDFIYQPLFDGQRRVQGILTFILDVTDRALARQQAEHSRQQILALNQELTATNAGLFESEERFRIMADAAPNIIWALNPDGSVRYVNKHCLEFLGISLAQFVAANWTPYLHPDDVAVTEQAVAQAIGSRTLFSMEHRMRRHDGQYRWLRTQGNPSYYPSGELFGYVGSAIDITELKEANQQLQRTNNDLDTFVYTASHDLKAPITNIEGLLDALRDYLPGTAGPPAEPMIPHLLQLMADSVARFQQTINQLTDVSRLQNAAQEPAEPVALAPLIEAIRLDLAPLLASSHGQLLVEVAACPTVLFSSKNLRSILYNLLSNAFKYASPDRAPVVRVQASCPSGQVRLDVHDNGLGLSAAQQAKLFTLFQRLHAHVEGTGVGLYMVKRMVENAGGTIQVQSEPGVGTTFTVLLPRPA